MSNQIQHPLIGCVRGKTGDGVVQFLGLKYASLAHIFAPSTLLESYANDGGVDATQLGPMVIQPPGVCDNEFGFIQKSLPMTFDMKTSELESLHLNITVPSTGGEASSQGRKLPVFVFVHGGGFSLGSNAWPQYDQARLVKLSSDLGTPVIGVGINYRVGLPGFLTSEEMRAAGCASNNGIRDQAVAFQWVKRYISGFGGDADNVTFMAESAGSVSGSLLLHHKEPLFKRYISMSGTSLMMRPLPPPVAEMVYGGVMQSLGLGSLTGAERVKALLAIPAEKLIEAAAPGLPLMPVVDGDIIPVTPTFAQISNSDTQPALSMPGRTWCTDLLIGDCQFDGSILSYMLGPRLNDIATTFCASITKSFASEPHRAEQLFEAYKITPHLPDNLGLRAVLQFATDIGFYAPVIMFAQGWPGTAHVYHFNERNPWEGKWKGEASHVLDVAYLFQNYNESLDGEQKEVARAFAGDFLAFMNGRTGWAAYERGGKAGARTYGPSGDGRGAVGYAERTPGEEAGREATIFTVGGNEEGLEKLAGAWGNFLAGQ